MSLLAEERVLRINSPGFGISSVLALGEAKPMVMYDVIIVNPASMFHLFHSRSDAIKQIEVLQSDGMTSYRADSDEPLESIKAEIDLRIQELAQFLKKGGLLVYFLSPPFLISGPDQNLDNYTWLGSWRPDKATESTQHNMSATIRGKTVEISPAGAQSVFQPYLNQPN